MGAGLPPVGRLTGDKIDHFLDVPGGHPANFGGLARRLRAQRGQRSSQFNLRQVLPGEVCAQHGC
jgi:hypothetical protein